MRALRVHELGAPIDVLRLEETETPDPGPKQVRIRVAAAALNFADDLMCRGQYQERPPLPFTPGMELAGPVVAVGRGSSFTPGQRVMALAVPPHGALAEEALALDLTTYAIPDSLGDVEAAAMLVTYQTAYVALHRRAAIQPGEVLLVHAGAGGVGSAAIQLGKAAGARVIATAGGAEKVEVCRELGADIAIDYRNEDFVKIVKEATEDRGADVIYDPVGGDTFDRSRKCIAWEGRLLVIGFASGRIPKAPANHALVKNYSILGVYFGRYSVMNPGYLEEVHADLMRLQAAGAIHPLIGGQVSLEEVPAAIGRLVGRGTVGKVVVVP
ncbi:MAG: NADPH:quinone oxidoreductase family protein [Myxococcota bacterium]